MNQERPENNTEDTAADDPVAKEKDATEATPRRRIQDSITSRDPTHKMNLDRRSANSERRCNNDSDYKGPPRRYTIDRRQNTKDRRKPDD